MNTNVYTLKQDQIGVDFKNLLESTKKYASFFGFVIQEDLGVDTNCQNVIEELRDYKIKESMESSWPGTKLSGSKKARVYCFNCNSDSLSVLHKFSSSFHEWIQPKLPEDLFFLRKDKSAWFVNISHEKDSYFNLDENELENLLVDLPQLSFIKYP
jgi:hypothetical protein